MLAWLPATLAIDVKSITLPGANPSIVAANSDCECPPNLSSLSEPNVIEPPLPCQIRQRQRHVARKRQVGA